MSTLKVNSIEPANAGSEDFFLSRAWVNFNGEGAVAIRASGNVSSITDGGSGNYYMNFSSTQTDANYATSGISGDPGSGQVNLALAGTSKAASITTSSVRFWNQAASNAAVDAEYMQMMLVR